MMSKKLNTTEELIETPYGLSLIYGVEYSNPEVLLNKFKRLFLTYGWTAIAIDKKEENPEHYLIHAITMGCIVAMYHSSYIESMKKLTPSFYKHVMDKKDKLFKHIKEHIDSPTKTRLCKVYRMSLVMLEKYFSNKDIPVSEWSSAKNYVNRIFNSVYNNIKDSSVKVDDDEWLASIDIRY